MTNPERIAEQVVEAQEWQEEGPGEEETAAVRCGAVRRRRRWGTEIWWKVGEYIAGLGWGWWATGREREREGSNRFTWFFVLI
jgi:hypothetical protein